MNPPADVPRPSDPSDVTAALADAERLAALQRAELLDTPPDAAFDRLTALAATVLGVPVSLVSLVGADRQFFKSARGLPEPWASQRETPLSHSFCQHVVGSAAPLVVTDARQHPLVRDNAAIDDIGVVAYAGFPILSREGQVLGSLCAIDAVPRAWTATELEVLRELASLAHTELELRGALRDADRAARDAQRASAERTAVIESSSDGIYTIDLTGRCTLVNSAAAAILGFARDDMVGRNMHALVHHHHADGTVFPEEDCALFHAFRDGRAVRVDGTTLWRRDGTSFPADCSSSPLFVDGRLAGAVVTFRDVSERVAAGIALRESEMKFRAIFEDAGVGIVITALDGRLLDCNEAYEQITGHSRADLRETMFDRVTHPDDVAEQRRLGESLIAGERDRFRMDKRYLRPDGSLAWARLHVTMVRDAAGGPRFIVAAVEDVTTQRRVVDAMGMLAEAGAVLASSLEYEETLQRVARLALPTLGDACLVDVERPDGSVESICAGVDTAREPTLRALHRGRPMTAGTLTAHLTRGVAADAGAAEVADRWELIPDLDGPEAACDPETAAELAAIRSLGARSLLRVPIVGRRRLLGMLTFASSDRSHTAHDVQVARELAARAASAIENALLYREAQSATRIRDEVLAVVSHDLRNPVHTITMSAAFLLDVPAAPETARAQLAVIRRSADRADRLIRDLLDVTRIENGRLTLDRQCVAGRRAPGGGGRARGAQGRGARAPAVGLGRGRRPRGLRGSASRAPGARQPARQRGEVHPARRARGARGRGRGRRRAIRGARLRAWRGPGGSGQPLPPVLAGAPRGPARRRTRALHRQGHRRRARRPDRSGERRAHGHHHPLHHPRRFRAGAGGSAGTGCRRGPGRGHDAVAGAPVRDPCMPRRHAGRRAAHARTRRRRGRRGDISFGRWRDGSRARSARDSTDGRHMQTTQLHFTPGSGWTELVRPSSAPPDAQLVLVFGERALLEATEVQATLRERFANAAIVCCSSGGEIAGDRALEGSVVATALHLVDTTVHAVEGAIPGRDGSAAAGEALVRRLPDERPPPRPGVRRGTGGEWKRARRRHDAGAAARGLRHRRSRRRRRPVRADGRRTRRPAGRGTRGRGGALRGPPARRDGNVGRVGAPGALVDRHAR